MNNAIFLGITAYLLIALTVSTVLWGTECGEGEEAGRVKRYPSEARRYTKLESMTGGLLWILLVPVVVTSMLACYPKIIRKIATRLKGEKAE